MFILRYSTQVFSSGWILDLVPQLRCD